MKLEFLSTEHSRRIAKPRGRTCVGVEESKPGVEGAAARAGQMAEFKIRLIVCDESDLTKSRTTSSHGRPAIAAGDGAAAIGAEVGA